MESHLLQMRGLKLRFPIPSISFSQSHLLQMRGLKLFIFYCKRQLSRSHLLQMRGLKLPQDHLNLCLLGRIFYRCVD